MRARAVSREITPDRFPVPLGGYAVHREAKHVTSALEVNCLFLQDKAWAIVLVSVDLLYVTRELRDAVLCRVERLGIRSPQLFMAASHTHYAPAIDSTKPALGQPDLHYRDRIADIIVEAIREAVLGPKDDVTVAIGQGSVSIGVNRRRRRLVRILRDRVEFNRVAMAPNPKGPLDPKSAVIVLRSRERIVAYIWSAACHPTGQADGASIGAHWPGAVRQRIRREHPEEEQGALPVPVLFLQGFSGDIRPPSGRTGTRHWRDVANRIRLGPLFQTLNYSEYSTWANLAAMQIVSIANRASILNGSTNLDCSRIESPASRFAVHAEHLPPVSFHRISIGPIEIVGASAELVGGYSELVQSLAPGRHVITVGCIDHVIGYWPLRHMFKEGGYEVVHHCPSFGIAACRPDIEETVLEQFGSLLAKPL